jgi:hypothetical protein
LGCSDPRDNGTQKAPSMAAVDVLIRFGLIAWHYCAQLLLNATFHLY